MMALRGKNNPDRRRWQRSLQGAQDGDCRVTAAE
jgi:hypothetical protein